jgi:cell division protein FtsI (penicillin-binding protein 3)
MSRARILIVSMLGGLVAATLLVRAAWLGIVEADRFGPQAMRQAVADLQLRGRRGDIVDRDGRPLAGSVPVWSLGAHRRNVQQPFQTATKLAPILRVEPERLFASLSGGSGFVWLKRWLTRPESEAVLALAGKGPPLSDEGQERRALKRAEQRLATELGVELALEARRYYVDRELAAHVLGFVDPDERGIEGIEQHFDAELRGRPLTISAMRDRRGNTFLKSGVLPPQSAGAGHTVVLTLDRVLQYEAEAAIARAAAKAGAKGAMAVVLEPSSGEVLALATWPRFNPNTRADSVPDDRRNKAIVDTFEPGSTMKPLSIGAAIEAGVVTPETRLFCHNGQRTFGQGRWKHTIKDVKALGKATVAEVIQYSSNICAGLIGERLGAEKLHAGLERFLLGKKTGVELPGEAPGVLRPVQRWHGSSVVTHAYGYGLSVTALQLASAYAAIANGGELVAPRIVREVRDSKERVVRRFERRLRGRALSAETARKLREMMVGVTERGGTGTRAAIAGYRIAGKTGTALKPSARGYSAEKRRVLFAGFAPAERARLAAVVVLDEPQGKLTGGLAAAPAWREIVEAGLRHLGVPAEPQALANRGDTPATAGAQESAASEGSSRKIRTPKASVAEAKQTGGAETKKTGAIGVPDLRGLGISSALQAATDRGLTLEVEGSGRAVRQDPPPGAGAAPGATVRVTFAREDG